MLRKLLLPWRWSKAARWGGSMKRNRRRLRLWLWLRLNQCPLGAGKTGESMGEQKQISKRACGALFTAMT